MINPVISLFFSFFTSLDVDSRRARNRFNPVVEAKKV